MLLCVILCAAAPVNTQVYKVILPATPMYEESQLNAKVMILLPQNATVTLVGESFMYGDIEWQKISYTTYTGFVTARALYRSTKNENYNVEIAKAVSGKMGEDINLYATHSFSGEVVCTVNDGEQLRIICDGVDYGEFLFVEYNGDYYFAPAVNVTTGLSYNQLLAVIIASCSVGALIIVAVTVVVIRKKRIR